jgi:hypothetical protein
MLVFKQFLHFLKCAVPLAMLVLQKHWKYHNSIWPPPTCLGFLGQGNKIRNPKSGHFFSQWLNEKWQLSLNNFFVQIFWLSSFFILIRVVNEQNLSLETNIAVTYPSLA